METHVIMVFRGSAVPAPPRPRRPSQVKVRRPDRTDAILAATYALLTEVGYEALTIDAVAARARASKATIYQRWASKRDLIIDAFQRAARQSLYPNVTGTSLLAELTSFVRATHEVSSNDDARAFVSLLAAAQQDPEIGDVLRAALTEPRRACREIVQRAIERGELPALDPDDCAERILEIVMGQVIAHQLVLGLPNDDAFVRDLVACVVLPVLQEMARIRQG